jgi:protein SCO1/2
MIRTPIALIPYVLAAAMVWAGLLWHEADNTPGLGRVVVSGTASVGGPFALTDQTGAARTDKDFRGRFLLIYFGYRLCPDVCPATLGRMADTLGALGAKTSRVVPIFITVDPERDTPGALKAYLASFGPEFVGLTGSVAAIAGAAKVYHVQYLKHPLPGGGYSVDHSSVIYLMGPDGRFVQYYDETISPDELAKDLRARL